MANSTRIEVNCTTGEVKEFELTDAEIELAKASAAQAIADADARAQAEADKLAAKASAQEKLAKLGLTADEIAALSA
jgi:hypothetical protein